MKKVIWILIAFNVLMSCNHKKSFCEINTVWMLVSENSTYYEFYFDDYQQFFYDGEYSLAFQLHEPDQLLIAKFKREMLANGNRKADSVSVLKYFSNVIKKDKKFITVRPIGKFCYHFSKLTHHNYFLFSTEAYRRHRKY